MTTDNKITIERETLQAVMNYASCDHGSPFRPHFDVVMKRARDALAALPTVNRYCRAGMCVETDKKHEPDCAAYGARSKPGA